MAAPNIFRGQWGCECAANAASRHLKRSLNNGLKAPLFASARINPRHPDSYSLAVVSSFRESRGCLLLLTEEEARVLWESSARVDAKEGLRSVNEKRVSLGGGLRCVRGECTPPGSLAGVSAGVWVRSIAAYV